MCKENPVRSITLLSIAALCLAVTIACNRSASNKETTNPAQLNNAKTEAPVVAATSKDSAARSAEAPKDSAQIQDDVHTPEKGSAERQAIMDALRGNQQVVFQVNYLKVHNGWAWVDTTPLDKSGKATAEGGPNLLHLEDGKWKVMDLGKVPDDPNDPLGPEDASPAYVKNVMKTFPGVPKDIFPKPSK